MSNVAMAELSSEKYFLSMPHEILFEIFRELPKGKLIEISRLCSKFRDVAGDTRLWKNVYIKYKQKVVAFEELYSEPWPVKVIDLQHSKIKPPVSSITDQVVKVFRLDLSSITADKATRKATLAKYQCKELYLDFNSVASQDHFMGIPPEAFSKQTALEVLGLRGVVQDSTGPNITYPVTEAMLLADLGPCNLHKSLASVLSNCKNLKTLHLSHIFYFNNDMSSIAKHLPTSLENLFLGYGATPVGYFFELLAESCPNLKELQLFAGLVKYPSLLKFQFLKVLHISLYQYRDFSNLCTCLIKFSALKTIHLGIDFPANDSETYLGDVRTKLEPHGIMVQPVRRPEELPRDGNLWKVWKAT